MSAVRRPGIARPIRQVLAVPYRREQRVVRVLGAGTHTDPLHKCSRFVLLWLRSRYPVADPFKTSTGATVMLIEDDDAVARTLTDALDLSAYRVWLASNAAEAKALLEQTSPDVIILDLM